MVEKKYDIAVIGAGPAGFSSAVQAAKLGVSVCLIEKSFIGGTCLNCGCIPTKFLWQALKIKQKIQKSDAFGFKFSLEKFSFADIILKKDKIVSNIRKGMEHTLKSHNITAVAASAEFKTKNLLKLSNGYEIFADKIIITTGSKPSNLFNIPSESNKIIDSAGILNLMKIPKKLLIVGGGVIGVEFAAIFSGFGSQVSVAETAAQILPNCDKEVSEETAKNLVRAGVEILTSCLNAFDNIESYDKVLIAVGRAPNNGLNFQEIGGKLNSKGFIETDNFCRTNIENVYAAGDITGKNFLAYTAQKEAETAAKNAVKRNVLQNTTGIVPQVVFSMPPSASVKAVGFDDYKDISYGKAFFTVSARAFIENERSGFVKCAVDKNSKKPIGFWIIGGHADELVNVAAQILTNTGSLAFSRESFFHPSLSEALYEAYENAVQKI